MFDSNTPAPAKVIVMPVMKRFPGGCVQVDHVILACRLVTKRIFV